MNGEKIKVLVFYKQQNWLEYGENIDLRMGHSAEKLNVKQRRVLTTKWIGEASEKLRGPQFQASMGSCFPITGCLITADGLEDHSKSLHNGYVVPRLLPIQTAQQSMTCKTLESETPPTDKEKIAT